MAKSEIVPVKVRTVVGDRPSHVHVCPSGEHDWECNSPYCYDRAIDCPDHGGPTPHVQGYEPWKGR